MVKMKVLCVVQARLTSSRLPNKVMMPLGKSGMTIVEHVYHRLSLCGNIDKVVFAIPVGETNDALAALLAEKDIPCFRGSEENVLERFYSCVKTYDPEIVVRATCDNPFVDWMQVQREIESLPGHDYVSSAGAPLGTSVEVFYAKGLYQAYDNASSDIEREHVTPYLYLHPELFKTMKVPYHLDLSSDYRLTVDTDLDYEVARRIYDDLYYGSPIPNSEVYEYLDEHTEVRTLNAGVIQKEQELIAKR